MTDLSPGGRIRFLTTHWSLVASAGDSATPESRASLARLCEIYWFPVFAYIRRCGASPDESRDLTQGFFTVFLEKNYVKSADALRGRFRSFLLASVQHFVANERDRMRAQKRGGHLSFLPLEFETAEGVLRREPMTGLTPEHIFERRWALTILERVLERLGAEQEAAGRGAVFALLRPHLAGDEPDETYAMTAASLDVSTGAVRIAVHRLRRRFRALLLEQIGQTVTEPSEIERELRHLVSALGSPSAHEGSGGYA